MWLPLLSWHRVATQINMKQIRHRTGIASVKFQSVPTDTLSARMKIDTLLLLVSRLDDEEVSEMIKKTDLVFSRHHHQFISWKDAVIFGTFDSYLRSKQQMNTFCADRTSNIWQQSTKLWRMEIELPPIIVFLYSANFGDNVHCLLWKNISPKSIVCCVHIQQTNIISDQTIDSSRFSSFIEKKLWLWGKFV